MQPGVKLLLLIGASAGAAYVLLPHKPDFPKYAQAMVEQRQPEDTAVTPFHSGVKEVPAGPLATAVTATPEPPSELENDAPQVPSIAPDDGAEPLILGQATPSRQQQTSPDTSPPVDESALRYFARQGDTRRLEAEIARLKALYPDWTPPADPLQAPQTTDQELDAIWALYAQGRIAEVRSRIAERQEREPAWQPPRDLLDRLALAEARQRLLNASDLKQYDTVIQLGSANPALLICAEMDVLWRVAEAFDVTDRPNRSRDVYRYILQNCDDPGERLATMQKAAAILDTDAVEELLSLERGGADGAKEFEPVRNEIARSALAKAGEDQSQTVSTEQIARIARLAETGSGPKDALLLGWYYLRRDRMEDAEKWFKMARQRQDSGPASEGLALALTAQGKNAAAEDVIYAWRADSDDRRKVYLAAAANLLGQEPRVALTPEVLKRIVLEVYAAKDVATARQLGWYARAYNQHQTAGQWFAAALGWDTEDEPAAYGLALTHLALGDIAELRQIQSRWAGRSQRIQDIGTKQSGGDRSETVPAPATSRSSDRAATPQSAPVRKIQGCTSYIDPKALAPSTALARGWCLMEINRPHEAAEAFEIALGSSSDANRRDASYGQSLAYLRAGLTDEAAVAATRAPQSAARASELQAAILADRALGAYEHGHYVDALVTLDQRAQYVPESIDLMVLRGYAYLSLNRTGDAHRIFKAVAGAGNREGLRGLAAVRERYPNSN